jgi:hypothetical protein
VIGHVVKASAFFAAEGAANDKFGDIGEVSEFEEVGGDDIIVVVLFDLFSNIANTGAGAVEAALGADNADIIPHTGADFIPVVFDNDGFVGRDGYAFFPEGDANIEIVGALVLNHAESGLVPAYSGF